MSIERVFRLGLAVLCLAASPLVAQWDGESPITLPELRETDLVVHEIEYSGTLPKGVVATIDGKDLTQADLLKELLETNLSTIANTLLMTKMADLELERAGVTIEDSEVQAELEEMMRRMAPGKTVDDLVKTGVYTRGYLDRVAKMQRAWKKLFWDAKKVPETQRNEQTNQLLMQIYINEVKAKYQLRLRGRNPAPPKGAIASLDTIVNGKKVSYVISSPEAIEFLVGLLRPATILDGHDKLIDDYLVRRAMDEEGVAVPDAEIESWVQEMTEKYPPPFTWDTILKIKGTTPDQERTRWRNVQAWKRVTRHRITNEELDAFRAEHEDFFRSKHVKVSHILVSTTDPVTGLPVSEEEQARALERAERIQRLASEGVDFDRLAKLYSDDKATAPGGGKMQQPIKKWGGGYAPEFQDIAYRMEKGEISEPVKTQFGYHIILCNEVSPPTGRQINWNESRYSEWILEEYETARMEEWLEGLREKADIDRVSDEKLLELKDADFGK